MDLKPSTVAVNLKPSTVAVIASVVMGTILIGVSLTVLLLRDDLSPELANVLRGIFALGAGGVSAGVFGTLEISGPIAGLTVKAGGPIAVTIIFYVVSPATGVQRLLGL